LNREHVAADAALLLTSLRERFFDRVKELVRAWNVQPVHVSVFGSAGRGEGDTMSDIDLFVVRPDDVSEDDDEWRSQIDELAESVYRWTGNQAGIAEFARSDLRRLARERPPIVEELERDAVTLAGPTVAGLFRTGKR
jgi:predicted nucleotidyltransferase